MKIGLGPDQYAEWYPGSRTINLYRFTYYINDHLNVYGARWVNHDCISFGYDKPDNTITQTEMLAVLIRHLEDVYLVDTCQHAEWRWLDCEECQEKGETCNVKVCVECGASVSDDPICRICGGPVDSTAAPWRTDTCSLRCAATAVTEEA